MIRHAQLAGVHCILTNLKDDLKSRIEIAGIHGELIPGSVRQCTDVALTAHHNS